MALSVDSIRKLLEADYNRLEKLSGLVNNPEFQKVFFDTLSLKYNDLVINVFKSFFAGENLTPGELSFLRAIAFNSDFQEDLFQAVKGTEIGKKYFSIDMYINDIMKIIFEIALERVVVSIKEETVVDGVMFILSRQEVIEIVSGAKYKLIYTGSYFLFDKKSNAFVKGIKPIGMEISEGEEKGVLLPELESIRLGNGDTLIPIFDLKTRKISLVSVNTGNTVVEISAGIKPSVSIEDGKYFLHIGDEKICLEDIEDKLIK